jgi:prevent-host-death family protein
MQKQISAIKARQNLGELLEEVYYKNDRFVITRRNKAMAIVISVDEYRQLLKQREKDFAVLDEIWAANKGVSPETVERNVATAIEEVRARKRPIHAKSRH